MLMALVMAFFVCWGGRVGSFCFSRQIGRVGWSLRFVGIFVFYGYKNDFSLINESMGWVLDWFWIGFGVVLCCVDVGLLAKVI